VVAWLAAQADINVGTFDAMALGVNGKQLCNGADDLEELGVTKMASRVKLVNRVRALAAQPKT